MVCVSNKDVSRTKDHVYTDGENEYPSVTTVLGSRDTDTTGLEIWKKRNSGVGDKADWRHLSWYARNRGTLLHYHVLNRLYNGELWGADETESIGELQQYNDDDSRVYSLLRHKKRSTDVSTRGEFYDSWTHVNVMDIFEKDKRWFIDTVEDMLDVCVDEILHVEQYLHSDTLQLGGQVDLVYRDVYGDVVVADLKTSSSLRGKHILQGYTYAAMLVDCGVVDHIDRIEVWQVNPELSEANIHSHDSISEYHVTDDWWNDEWDNYDWDSHDEIYQTIGEVRTQYDPDAYDGGGFDD